MTRRAWWAAIGLVVGLVPVPGVAAAAEAPFAVQLVESTSAADLSDKQVTALCPAGTSLYSGGGRVDDRSGAVVVEAVRPLRDLSGVVVRASALGPADARWRVTASALCAPGAPRLVRGGQFRSAGLVIGQQTASCAVPGSLTGVFGEVVGNDPADQATLAGLVPGEGLTSGTAKATGPSGGQWSAEVSVVCAEELAGELVRVVADTGYSSADVLKATATCAEGYQLIGGAGSAQGNTPDAKARLLEVAPDPGTGSVTAVGAKGASPWRMEAYAICLKA